MLRPPPWGGSSSPPVLSGVAWAAIAKKFDDVGEHRVNKIPKFINTPLDLLAISIFDLLSPMFVKLASVDGEFDELERNMIVDYFVECWGYDESFVRVSIDMANESALTFSEIIRNFVEFIRSNPDCNATIISHNVMAFLREIAEASNGVVDREHRALLEAESALVLNGLNGKSPKDIKGRWVEGLFKSLRRA